MPDSQFNILIRVQQQLEGLRTAVDGIQGLNRTLVDTSQRFRESQSAGRQFAEALKSGLGIDLARRGVEALQGVARAFERFVSAGVQFNAMLEQQGVAFETLLGSREKAEQRMRDLVRLAATTPFELGEVVAASRVLQALAGDSLAAGDGLRLIGDAAAAVGRPFQEVAFWVGRLAAALKDGLPLGEPIMRLTEMGLISSETRKRLAELSGQALSTSQVMDVLRTSFGATAGAMQRQAETFTGMISTLKDSLNQLAGEATKPIFESFVAGLKEVLQLLGAMPTETEKVVADLEAKVQRLQEAARTAGTQQQDEVRKAADDLLAELRARERDLRTLLAGRAVFGAEGEVIKRPQDREDFARELDETARAIRGVEVALGLLGRAEGLSALAARTREVREEITRLEAQAADVRTTVREERTGRELFPRGFQQLPEEDRPRALQTFASAVEAQQIPGLRVFRTSALDEAGQKRLADLRAELASLEQTPEQRAAQAEQKTALEQAQNLAAGLLAREQKITEEYRKQAEPLEEKEQRLQAELAALRQRHEEAAAQLALDDRSEEREKAAALEQRDFLGQEAVLQGELAKIEDARAKARADADKARLDAAQKVRAAEEAAAQASDRALARELAASERRRAGIDSDRLLTAEEKQLAILPLLQEENRLIAERIRFLEQELALNPDQQRRTAIEDRLERLRTRQAQTAGGIAAATPLDVRGQVGADLASITDSWGTSAQRVAALFTGPIRNGLEAARDGMERLLGTTEFWSRKLGTIGGAVMGSVSRAISDMFTQWIAGRIRQSAIHLGLVKAEAASETAAKTGPALLTSISTFGVAVAIGVAALTAALAGFASGGLVRGGERLIRVNEQGEEFILRNDAVERFGADFLAQLNAGVLNLAALPDDISVVMPRAAAPARAEQAPGGTAAGASAPGAAPTVNVDLAMVNTHAAFRDFMRREGSKMAFDFATRRTRRL